MKNSLRQDSTKSHYSILGSYRADMLWCELLSAYHWVCDGQSGACVDRPYLDHATLIGRSDLMRQAIVGRPRMQREGTERQQDDTWQRVVYVHCRGREGRGGIRRSAPACI